MNEYTEQYLATCDEYELLILVKPGTDLDSRFKAWDVDCQEFIYINGWLWTFERVDEMFSQCKK